MREESIPIKGSFLENLTWKEAEALLDKNSIIVIPLGAQCKEHGLHLPLNNDWLIAEFLKERVAERLDVIVAPTINYANYPAMKEYPGTVSLRSDTTRDTIIDICKSLSTFGPRKFYVLNTGISTLGPLEEARGLLSREQIKLRFTDLKKMHSNLTHGIEEQERGSHADEIETSLMLYIAPERVRMELAMKDCEEDSGGPLSRARGDGNVFSPTGAWGDPTLATREKGRLLMSRLVDGIMDDITRLRSEDE